MANTLLMDQHFERDKNLKASGITAVVCACLFLLFFLVNWTVPVVPKPEILEGIEVNLGTSDNGSGQDQPLVQGSPGPTASNNSSTAQQSAGAPASASEDKNDEKDPEGPPATSKAVVKVTNPNPAPVKKADPKPPAPPSPKTVMPKFGGGTGKGNGNTNESYNKPGNEGDGTGKGDKGNPNGTPNGKGYTGTGGNGVVQIKGDRKMMYYPSRASDVEPGVVTVVVSVTPSGVGTFVDFKSGKFLATYKTEIISYLKGVTFNKADHESTIEMTFNFKR